MPTNREIWEQAFAESRVRDVDYTTMSGIPLDPVYGPDDGSGDYPGQYPYTRGTYASKYPSKLWTMRMFAGFGTVIIDGLAPAQRTELLAGNVIVAGGR